MRGCWLAVGVTAAAAGLGTAQAQTGAAQPPALQALSECRAVADDARRLACFDAAAARLLTAERAGEVVVVDRAQAREARRQAFGFNLPSLDIFRRGEPEADMDELALTVARASQDPEGKWVLRTREGQTWRQTDTRRLGRAPKAGSRVEVRRASMGSYLANVDGQTAIRVRREQ